MEGFGLIMTIILGALAGWIAEKVMKFDTGLMMNIVLGVAGAVLGNFILRSLGMSFGGLFGQIIVAYASSYLLIYVYRMIKSR